MKVRYRILDSDNKTIACNLSLKEIDKIKEINSSSQKILDGKGRAGKIETKEGSILAFTTEKDLVASSSKFKTIIEALSASLSAFKELTEEFKEKQNKNTKRLIHNLTSLNAHNIQEIYSIIPQEVISKRTGTHVRYVEGIVKDEPRDTALALLRIAKNNAAMKAEFAVFKKLFTSNPTLDKKYHNVHKVLMNIFYLFFPDFTDKEVKVEFGESSNTAFFDYESIHVALYHLIENATKYIKQKSTLTIKISEDGSYSVIEMSMISMKISEHEKERIFEEGVSGDIPKKLNKSGDGIGLNRVKSIINLNLGTVDITPKPETTEMILGIPYQRNIFTIKLPRRHSDTAKLA